MRFWIFNLGHLVQMHAILRNDYLSVSINACPLVEMYVCLDTVHSFLSLQ